MNTFSGLTNAVQTHDAGIEFHVLGTHPAKKRYAATSLNNLFSQITADSISDDVLRHKIQDWGIGFNPSNVSEDRFGLQGIRERAQLMRGRAQIDSALGKGTRIIVDLPKADPLENL